MIKLAGVVITYNDGFKFEEWCKWYDAYREELDLLIIVDNGSEPEYLMRVESYFKDAIIIKRSNNGGCTSAYNDGIKCALKDAEVTHIALIGNDIRIERGGLSKCVRLLDSRDDLGMVAPVLLNADSDIVADYGCSINKDLSMNPYGVGLSYQNLEPQMRICEAVTGGMNVSKRSFYEVVGLQDETLFMYSDEVDMGLRAKKAGFKMAVTKEAKSWHQHINIPGNKRRMPFSRYLIARNKVYVAYKHFGLGRALFVFNKFLFTSMKGMLICAINGNRVMMTEYKWMLWGAINGIVRNMEPNKYSSL